MTAKELIEELEKLPPDTPVNVRFWCDETDYGYEELFSVKGLITESNGTVVIEY